MQVVEQDPGSIPGTSTFLTKTTKMKTVLLVLLVGLAACTPASHEAPITVTDSTNVSIPVADTAVVDSVLLP